MKISDERLTEYNNRMNDWIAKQGLIFQLTHGGTGLGGKPPIIGSIIRFIISIFLLVLLASVSYAGFLFWKATGDDLPKQLQRNLAGAFGVEELTAEGFERDLSSGEYKRILIEGNDATFFNSLEARGIEFPMEPASGLFGDWDAKKIRISELKVALKAGEADDQRAQDSWQSLFYQSPSFTFSTLNISKVSLTWGYSTSATWGSIINSSLAAHRTEEGWDLTFKGGNFSQGILRDFAIETISVKVTKEGGFKVNEAKLTRGEGTFQWSGEMLTGGARPSFEFKGQLTAIPLAAFLPRGLLSIVNGAFSGEIQASGAINDALGINFQIEGQPDQDTGIVLTKELVLLRMLSHLDPQRSYRKVSFNQGSFKLSTKGNELSFTDIDLTSEDADSTQSVAQLRGNFEARPTTKEELERETYGLDEESQNTSETIGAAVNDEMSIEDQALFATSVLRKHKSLQFDNPPQELFYFTKDSNNEELLKKRLDLAPRRTFRFPYVVEGQLELAVPTTAFEDSPPLPGVLAHEDNASLQWIQIDLRDMIQASTEELTEQWEQTLNEAAESE